MLTASLNTPKTAGHAMVVGAKRVVANSHDHSHDDARDVLVGLGYEIDCRDDPYAAMLELCRRPLVYRAIVFSLQGLYRDELVMISTVRRRFPHVNIYLTDTDGRQASLAEAMRLGAEGLIDATGLHSLDDAPAMPAPPRPTHFRPVPSQANAHERHEPVAVRPEQPATTAQNNAANEPVLTADELRALLGDDL